MAKVKDLKNAISWPLDADEHRKEAQIAILDREIAKLDKEIEEENAKK